MIRSTRAVESNISAQMEKTKRVSMVREWKEEKTGVKGQVGGRGATPLHVIWMDLVFDWNHNPE